MSARTDRWTKQVGDNPSGAESGHPGTVCPGSSDPYYIVSYYINWVNTSWTYSIRFRYKVQVSCVRLVF